MLNMSARIQKDGRLWQVTFGYANKHKIKVTAKDLNGGTILTAPTHSKEILDILPIENWPAFAVPLANMPDNSNQERLF